MAGKTALSGPPDSDESSSRAHSLVLVEWLDSRRGEGWVRLDELEGTVTRCRSVGWIVAKDSSSVTLASHLGEDPAQCCGDMTIPLRSVLKMVPIPVPRTRQH